MSMQAGTTKDFVAMAKTRPYTEERQKQFAIARTQAQLKIPREEAEKLVEEVWEMPLDQLRVRRENHGAPWPTRYAEHQQPTAAPVADPAADVPPGDPPPAA